MTAAVTELQFNIAVASEIINESTGAISSELVVNSKASDASPAIPLELIVSIV